MPELPEVETIRRQLEPLLVGRQVVDASSHPSAKFTPALDAVGAALTSVDRRGKYLLVGLDHDRELVLHLGMTGSLRLVDDDPWPLSQDPYVRARWRLADGEAFELRDVRRFGRLAVVPTGDHRTIPTLHALGPEPFDERFTPEHLRAEVNRSRARVKTQLLGQRVVAGVGNIYADEALWAAGVHPARRQLTRRQATLLRDAVRHALAAGLRHGGTTLRDYRTVDGGTGEGQHHLRCYGRAGEPCERCGEVLRRLVLDGRTSTYCGSCQPR